MEDKTMRRKNLFSLVLVIFSSLIVIVISNLVLKSNELYTSSIIAKNGLIISLLLCFILFAVTEEKKFVYERNKFSLFLTLEVIVIIPSLFISVTDYYWLMPFMISSMIISIMIDKKLGIFSNIFITLIVAIVGNLSISFILFYIISGTIACLLINQSKERQKIFYVSMYMIVINIILIFFISLLKSSNNFNIEIMNILFVIINAGFSVIITVGSLPLWETIFDVMTPYKLLELINSDQKLLQRLMLEAPGTYHHSQMVANLAETAVADIGGNALLARTGALYHDIGKLRNPEYFTENQNGDNPHDDLPPDSSAKIIISHVSDGVRIAKEYNLPKSIINIIKEHQGDSIVKYFYFKAKENSDGDIDEKIFTYDGPKPLSNEAAIVMLSDCVEASVRAIDEKQRTMDIINKSINDIISSKFKDGQLDKCNLKIKELPIIANAFKKVYNGMYHERVKYPKE